MRSIMPRRSRLFTVPLIIVAAVVLLVLSWTGRSHAPLSTQTANFTHSFWDAALNNGIGREHFAYGDVEDGNVGTVGRPHG